jgi:hypothetical protein
MSKNDINIQNLKLDTLEIDSVAYQRAPNPSRVQRIVAEWSPVAAGVLTVNRRTNAHLFVIDGGHRLLAMRALGIKQWPCIVYDGLDVTEESIEFVRAQNRTALLHAQVFKARISGGDPVALEIVSIVSESGLKVGGSELGAGSPNVIRAPKIIEAIYNTWGADHLRYVLRVLLAAWPREKRALGAGSVHGLAYFLANANKYSVAEADIVHKFQLTTALEIEHKARDFKGLEGGRVAGAYHRAYAEFYNRGRRSQKVPFENTISLSRRARDTTTQAAPKE